MTPDKVPAELKAMLDEDAGKDHSATGAVMTSLARILTRHRSMVHAEVDRLREELEAARRPNPFAELDEETNKVIRDLMYAYRGMITAVGTGRPAEVLDLERKLDRLLCQCCVFGNHDIRCTCDGAECCHPEMYLEYNPEWGHGKDWVDR